LPLKRNPARARVCYRPVLRIRSGPGADAWPLPALAKAAPAF